MPVGYVVLFAKELWAGQLDTMPSMTDCFLLCFSRSFCHKGALQVVSDRWEATGWSDSCPVAEWQFIVLGCHGDLSSVNGTANEAGAAAEVNESRKEAKYADIDRRCVFEPIAVQSQCFQLLHSPSYE